MVSSCDVLCVVSLTRVALCLLVLHYAVELVFHISRIMYFSEKTDISEPGYVRSIMQLLMILPCACVCRRPGGAADGYGQMPLVKKERTQLPLTSTYFTFYMNRITAN